MIINHQPGIESRMVRHEVLGKQWHINPPGLSVGVRGKTGAVYVRSVLGV